MSSSSRRQGFSDRLNLPNDLRKWPRSLHARLTTFLTKNGPPSSSSIFFSKTPRSAPEDAGRRVDPERPEHDLVRTPPDGEDVGGGRPRWGRCAHRHLEARPPVPSLARSAAALAPFPLPKVPLKVSKNWTFKTGRGHPHAARGRPPALRDAVYDEFIDCWKMRTPLRRANPRDNAAAVAPGASKRSSTKWRSLRERAGVRGKDVRRTGRRREPPEDREKRRCSFPSSACTRAAITNT